MGRLADAQPDSITLELCHYWGIRRCGDSPRLSIIAGTLPHRTLIGRARPVTLLAAAQNC
jgi:hypothetical protein